VPAKLNESVMREDTAKYFVCPTCRESLRIESVENKERDRIKEGSLICGTAQHRFQVRGFIPRFVSMILKAPPQLGQYSMSMSKTRLSSRTQLMYG
jgi:uncharacterized protein YbaR (Trm112 family)